MEDNVTRNLDKLIRATSTAKADAAAAMGFQALNDAVMVIPTVPLDEGTLRASGSVHVDGEFRMKSPDPKGNGTPFMGTDDQHGTDEFSIASVAFNTPYAAKVHESPELNFQEAGSGAFFLTNKLVGLKRHYYEIARKVFWKQLRKGLGLAR